MILPPRTRLNQALIPLEIGDIAALGASARALGIVGSLTEGFAATVPLEIGGAITLESVGAISGTLLASIAFVPALAGAIVVGSVLVAAPFIENEGLLADLADKLPDAHAYLSRITQAVVAGTGIIESYFGSNITFEVQKEVGAIGEFINGFSAESADELFLNMASSAAGALSTINDVTNTVNSWIQPSATASPQSGPQGSSMGTYSPASGSPSSGGMYPFAPGFGDSNSYGFSSEGGFGGEASSFGDGGFTMTINAGGSDAYMPGEPMSTTDPPSSEPEPAPEPTPEPTPDPGPEPEPEPAPDPGPEPDPEPTPPEEPGGGIFY